MADPTLPNIPEWVIYAGMIVGGAIATFVVRMGWKKEARPDQNLVVSGQASITDMAPVRDLVKQADILCIKLMATTVAIDGMATQQARVAGALETLAVEVRSHLKSVRDEMEADNRQDEIDRKARILAGHIVRKHEDEQAGRRPTRKPPA